MHSVIKQASTVRAYQLRYNRKQTWRFCVGGCLVIAFAAFVLMALVPELRSLSCRSGASSTMTCQLTYQNLVGEDVKVVKGVQSVDVRQEERTLSWLLGAIEPDPYKQVAAFLTVRGSYDFKTFNHTDAHFYNRLDNHVASDELNQLHDRIVSATSSPSEGLSMSFSRRYWRDFGYLIFEGVTILVSFLFPMTLPAFFILLSLAGNRRPTERFLPCLKKQIFSFPNCYFWVGSMAILLKAILHFGTSPSMLLNGGIIVLLVGLPFVMAALILSHASWMSEKRSLLDLATFSQRFNALCSLSDSTRWSSTELSDWQKQQALSFTIHDLAAEITRQHPSLTPYLSDILDGVLQLNARFSAAFKVAHFMKILSYSSVGHATASSELRSPYRQISQQRFWDSNQRLVEIRQRLNQTQENLQMLADRLLVKDWETKDLSATWDVLIQLKALTQDSDSDTSLR